MAKYELLDTGAVVGCSATGIMTMCFFTGQFLSPLLVQPMLAESEQPSLFIYVGMALFVLSLAYQFLAGGCRHIDRSGRQSFLNYVLP